MKLISAVLLVVLAVIGASYLIREISVRLFRSSKERTVLLITFPGESAEEVESALRSALSRYGKRCMVCVKSERGSEEDKIVRAICREYGVKLLTVGELREIIDSMELEKP